MAGVKLNLSVEMKRFYAKAREWQSIMGRMTEEGVKSAGISFLQSAIKKTPQAKKKRRDIKVLKKLKNKKSTRYSKRYKVSSLASGRYAMGFAARQTKYFGSKAEANNFAKIKFRGVARAGWFGALQELGGATSATMTPDARAMSSALSSARLNKYWGSPQVEITNKANAYDAKKMAAAHGYKQAEKRLYHAIKEAKKKMKGVG